MADGVNDEGIKISAPYYDVDTAGDINLMFSSSWPSLPVGFEKTFTLLNTDYPKLVPHGLGFPPLAMGWYKDPSSNRAVPHYNIQVDKTNLYIYNDLNFGAGQTCTYAVKAYALDISKNATYPFIQQPQGIQTTYDPNYGIKLSKEGKSANSKDLRDFIIHSRTRSPLILNVQAVNDQTTDQTLKYLNPGGYVPWVFGFGSGYVISTTTPVYTPAIVGSQAYPRLLIDKTTGEMSVSSIHTQGGLASLIVLRDPLFAGQQVNVSY